MTTGVALFAWMVAAQAYIDTGEADTLTAGRERIEGREFWVLRDPDHPIVSQRELRERDGIGYRVLIEVGLETELPEWVHTVGAVLADERGWAASGRPLLPVADHARVSVLLADPSTVDRLCKPLRTRGKYSCGRNARASLNLTRWREGIETWAEDVEGYRVYMVNHEVGHLLGMPHQRCPGEGEPAPVMLQQSFGLDGCEARGRPTQAELDGLRERRARWRGAR